MKNLIYNGQKQPVSVICLRKQLKLYRPLNTAPLRLLSKKEIEGFNKWLNSPKRWHERRKIIERSHKWQ